MCILKNLHYLGMLIYLFKQKYWHDEALNTFVTQIEWFVWTMGHCRDALTEAGGLLTAPHHEFLNWRYNTQASGAALEDAVQC